VRFMEGGLGLKPSVTLYGEARVDLAVELVL
jgi:hypothetical protein